MENFSKKINVKKNKIFEYYKLQFRNLLHIIHDFVKKISQKKKMENFSKKINVKKSKIFKNKLLFRNLLNIIHEFVVKKKNLRNSQV